MMPEMATSAMWVQVVKVEQYSEQTIIESVFVRYATITYRIMYKRADFKLIDPTKRDCRHHVQEWTSCDNHSTCTACMSKYLPIYCFIAHLKGELAQGGMNWGIVSKLPGRRVD